MYSLGKYRAHNGISGHTSKHLNLAAAEIHSAVVGVRAVLRNSEARREVD